MFLLFVQYLHGRQMPSELGIRSFELIEQSAWNNEGMQSIHCIFMMIYAVYRLRLLTELCSVRTASLRKRCGLALAYALGRFNLSFAYVLGKFRFDFAYVLGK